MAQTQKLDLIISLKDKASKALSNFEKKVGVSSEKIKAAGRNITAFGAAGVAGLGMAIKQSSDLAESINAVDVVFKDGASIINDFGKNAAKNIGIANSEFNTLASQTGALLLDTGKPLEEVADTTTDLATRAADMASVMNTSVADAFSAINQAVRGETEAIRRYTGDVTDATLQQFLIAEGVNKSVTELNEQEKRLYRVSLIMQQTDKFAGDFARTSGEAANQQRILTAQIKDVSASIGDSLRPIYLSLLKVVEKVVSWVSAWIKENPQLAKTLIIIVGVVSALMLVIGPFLVVLPGIIALFTALSAPILIVIGVITALIAVGVAVMLNWDKIKAKAVAMWGSVTQFIKKHFGSVIEYIKAQLQFMLALFDAIRNPSVDSFTKLWDALKNVAFSAFNMIKDGVKAMINFAIDKINSFIRSANKVADKVPGAGIINIPEIPRLAKGGIVSKPTLAMVGEDGPEAVIPLNRKNNPKGIGMGGITVIVQGSVTSERDLIDVIKDTLVDDLALSTAVA